ncbi:MAG: ascorbate-dependent monooxygenase [Sulfurifustis sp.]
MQRSLYFLACLLVALSASARAGSETGTLKSDTVTYSEQIARIVQDNCQICHRTDGVAPFPLMTYQDAFAFRHQIADATRTRRMPPWKPVAGYGEFQHERRLSEGDIELIARWVAAGAPEGDRAKLPPPKKFASSWAAEPDVVVELSDTFDVPAGGSDIYRCFVIPTSFKEDRYVSASEVLPGNRQIVHHVITYLDRGKTSAELDRAEPGAGYTCFGGPGIPRRDLLSLGGWAPGAPPMQMPDGVGMLVPAGATVVVQVHYHNHTGAKQTDRTKIGLRFAKGPIEKRSRSIALINRSFEIPAGAMRHEVRASYTVPAHLNFHAINITPHMHLLGREMKVTARYPDGTVRPLIYINDWDFNWQGSYLFAKPVPLPAGTVIELQAFYDNTASNPRQPSSPPKVVRWGENTTDEMCIAFLRVTVDEEHGVVRPSSTPSLERKPSTKS